MMTFAEFHNALRIMASIDMADLVNAGALSDDDTGGWQAFVKNPWSWFIRAGDDEAAAVWRIIVARQPKKAATPPTPDPLRDAAGELLAALKAFMHTRDRVVGVYGGDIVLRTPQSVIEAGAAAIARAEGR